MPKRPPGGNPARPSRAVTMEKRVKAFELRKRGKSYKQIAEALGCTKGPTLSS